MLKKTITFENFEGDQLSRDYYFSLTKAQILRMNLQNMVLDENGEPDVNSFKEQLEAIIKSKSGRVIIDTFEDIIAKAYGERDPDGITFHRSEELSRRFMNTKAYDALFVELVTDAKAAAEFVNGIMPQNMDLPVDAEKNANLQTKIDAIVKPDTHQAFPEPKTPLGLPANLADMSREELLNLIKNR